MPENSDEKQEKEALKEHIDTKPIRKKYKRFKDPRMFAKFLLEMAPGYVWLDGLEVRKKFPNLKMSPTKINEFMNSKEFKDEVLAQIPEVDKEKSGNMFNMILLKYFKGQMELDIPHHKSLVVFGQISGKYDPTQKIDISGGMALTEEKEKEFKAEIEKAIMNRARRLVEAKGGEGNGE